MSVRPLRNTFLVGTLKMKACIHCGAKPPSLKIFLLKTLAANASACKLQPGAGAGRCRAYFPMWTFSVSRLQNTHTDWKTLWTETFFRSGKAATSLCLGVAAGMPTPSRLEGSASKLAKRRKITHMHTKTTKGTTYCCEIKCTNLTVKNWELY